MSCCSGKDDPAPRRVAEGCCGGEPEAGQLPEDIWLRLGIALVVAGQTMVWGLAFNLSTPEYGSQGYLIGHGWMILSTLLVVALLGPSLVQNALQMIHRRRLTVEGLFLVTACGAFVASLIATFTGEGSVYYEVVSVVLVIYTTGSFIGQRTRDRLRESARDFEQQFDRAERLSSCGRESEMVEVRELTEGDRIRIEPGGPIPVDGRIVNGTAYLEEMTLTGEPFPRSAGAGDRVVAGSWSMDGRIEIEVLSRKGERSLDALLHALGSAREKPSRHQHQADRITQWFLPAVLFISAATFFGWVGYVPWPEALFNSMAVLLVACPCALGLATPIAVWSGLWRLFQLGMVSRSAELVDTLAQTRRIFFDKTGTLSEAGVEVTGYERLDGESTGSLAELARLVWELESGQTHPIARALAEWAKTPGEGEPERPVKISEVRLLAGKGLAAKYYREDKAEPSAVFLGHPSAVSLPSNRYRAVLAVGGTPAIGFFMEETFRETAMDSFPELEQLGISTEILTGDTAPLSPRLNGLVAASGVNPAEKAERVRKSREAGEHPLYIGDGLNDLAALREADASLALSDGAELAKELATGLLQGSNLDRIGESVRICRKLQQTLRENLWFAAAYNGIGICLAAAGLLHPVVAALLMLGSSALVSIRAAGFSEQGREPIRANLGREAALAS